MSNARTAVLYTGRVLPNPQWRMEAHSHDHHELIVILRGKVHVRGPGIDDDCGAGDVLLYPKGVAHAEWSDPGDPLESIFAGIRSPRPRASTIIRAADGRGRMRTMIQWLYEDRLSSDAARRALRDALASALIAELMAHPGTDDMVGEIRGWVTEHVAEPIRLEDLARRAGLSKYYFVRRYRAASGRTPMEDVRAIRLDYARGLLLSTRMTLKEIAPLAGIGSEYSLSRAFREVLGASPRALRRFSSGRPVARVKSSEVATRGRTM